MSFTLLWTILRASWVSALAVWGGLIALVVLVSVAMPKSYTASASVLLDVKSSDPISGPIMATQGYVTTQVDVIQSERVARKAIAALGLNRNAQLRQEWTQESHGAGDFESWLATQMARNLDIKPSRDSNVVTVSYTSRDPKFSAAAANAYVKGYLDTSLELRTEPARRFSDFFDERAKKFREDVETAQAKLSAYHRAKGIVASDERLDVENMRLSEISSQVVALEAAAAEASSRLGQAGATPERMQEVLNNPVVSGLQADLSRQEARLQELTARLGEANPQVIEARLSINEMRSKLAAAVQRASGSVSVSSNVAQSRLAQLRAAREEQRAKVLKLRGSRDELSVLQRDLENAQRAYDAVMARASQSGLESEVRQTNVSVVKDATPPGDPSSPKLFLNVAIALVVGLIAAIATALLRELKDQRLRLPTDVHDLLRQHLLVVMPKSPTGRGPGKPSLQIRQRIAEGQLPLAGTR